MLSTISWYGPLQPKISQGECQRSPYLRRCKTHLLWFALNTVYCILHYMRPSVQAIPIVQGTGNREMLLRWSNYIPRDNYRVIRKISAFYHLPLAIQNHYSQSYWNQKHLKFISSLHSLNLPSHIWDFMLNHFWFCYREITQWVYMNYSHTCI